MTTEQYLLYWILSGIPGILYFSWKHIKEEGIVTVQHLMWFTFFFALGGLVTLGASLFVGEKIVSAIRDSKIHDKVIWRSRANRNKTVLFGDKDIDD